MEIEIVDSTGDVHQELIDLPIVNLGKHEIFLGFDWLKLHNPLINWQKEMLIFVRCQDCGMTIDEEPPELLPLDDDDDRAALGTACHPRHQYHRLAPS